MGHVVSRSNNHHSTDIAEKLDQTIDSLREQISPEAFKDLARDLKKKTVRAVEKHPLRALGCAAAIGMFTAFILQRSFRNHQ